MGPPQEVHGGTGRTRGLKLMLRADFGGQKGLEVKS